MAKLTSKQLSKLSDKAARYRWEFLRRNEAYGKSLQQFKKEAKRRMAAFKAKASFKDFEWAKKAWADFSLCWGLTSLGEWIELPSPDKSYDQLTPFEKKMLHPCATKPSLDVVRTLAGLLQNSKKQRPELLSFIDIKINLWMPQRVIMQDVEAIVRSMKEARKHYGCRDVTKHRYDEYKDFLKIYDLRKNKEMKYTDIYKVIHKGVKKESEITREDETRMAQGYLRAKELVESGYRSIW